MIHWGRDLWVQMILSPWACKPSTKWPKTSQNVFNGTVSALDTGWFSLARAASWSHAEDCMEDVWTSPRVSLCDNSLGHRVRHSRVLSVLTPPQSNRAERWARMWHWAKASEFWSADLSLPGKMTTVRKIWAFWDAAWQSVCCLAKPLVYCLGEAKHSTPHPNSLPSASAGLSISGPANNLEKKRLVCCYGGYLLLQSLDLESTAFEYKTLHHQWGGELIRIGHYFAM